MGITVGTGEFPGFPGGACSDRAENVPAWNRQPGSLSAENGAGRLCGKAGSAGAEGAGVPDALFQQQLKPADP